MAVTILEALENANYNIKNNEGIGLILAKDQLNNAVELLNKGYGLYEKVEPLIEKYGYIENVPGKDNLIKEQNDIHEDFGETVKKINELLLTCSYREKHKVCMAGCMTDSCRFHPNNR